MPKCRDNVYSKKGETFEPDYTLQNKLRLSSAKALSLFSKDIIASNDIKMKNAFANIPMLLESLHIALKEFSSCHSLRFNGI